MSKRDVHIRHASIAHQFGRLILNVMTLGVWGIFVGRRM